MIKFWEKYIKPQWLSLHGLFGTEGMVLILFFCYLKDSSLFILFILFISVFLTWLYQRRLPTFSPEIEAGILFAFPLESDFTKEQMKKLRRTINFSLNQKKLRPLIKIKDVPSNHLPKNEEEAHKVRDKSRARLIIWGNIEEGYKSGEKSIRIIPIKFSYKINLSKDGTKMINENFSDLLRETKWDIRKNDDINDRTFLSESIQNISLYIIGLILNFSYKGSCRESINILKEVNIYYKKKKSLSKQEKEALSIIKSFILKNLLFIIKDKDFSPKDRYDGEKIKTGLQLIKEIREIDSNAPEAYALEAILKFIAERDWKAALELVHKQDRQSSYQDASYSYNKSFLNFYGENFDDGFAHLQEAVKKERDVDNPIAIIKFYEETLEQEPDKKQLHFPLGYLYLKDLGEKEAAQEELTKFVDMHRNDKREGIEKLLVLSQKLLDEIKQD